jgi:hypothetical protein
MTIFYIIVEMKKLGKMNPVIAPKTVPGKIQRNVEVIFDTKL